MTKKRGYIVEAAFLSTESTPLGRSTKPKDFDTSYFLHRDVVNATTEFPYYTPWLRLLQQMFPDRDHYSVRPQYLTKHGAKMGYTDLDVAFIVCRWDIPMVVCEIKNRHLLTTTKNAERKRADKQIRARLLLLAKRANKAIHDAEADAARGHHYPAQFVSPLNLLPVVYGICAFGPFFCVYEMELPNIIMPLKDTTVRGDPAPFSWWQLHATKRGGLARLRQIADIIIAQNAARPPVPDDDVVDPDLDYVEGNLPDSYFRRGPDAMADLGEYEYRTEEEYSSDMDSDSTIGGDTSDEYVDDGSSSSGSSGSGSN